VRAIAWAPPPATKETRPRHRVGRSSGRGRWWSSNPPFPSCPSVPAPQLHAQSAASSSSSGSRRHRLSSGARSHRLSSGAAAAIASFMPVSVRLGHTQSTFEPTLAKKLKVQFQAIKNCSACGRVAEESAGRAQHSDSSRRCRRNTQRGDLGVASHDEL
jgi:hypothetical protein